MSHKKSKNPSKRIIQADEFTFQVCRSLGWSYSDVFAEGYTSLLGKTLKCRQNDEIPVGFLPITLMDLVIQDLDEKIRSMQETKKILEKVRESQSNLIILPKKDREIAIIFSELADKYLTDKEIEEYRRLMSIRIDRGDSCSNVVSSFLKDLTGRANGSGAIISEISKKDPTWKESIIYNYLTTRQKT